MFTHPYITGELARYRQRAMLVQADQQRLVRKLRELARASRRPEHARRPMTRSLMRGRRQVLPS
jgi:hypothetical protein